MKEKRITNVLAMLSIVIIGFTFNVAAKTKPLKVYILAGQSNMQGSAHKSTFAAIGDDPKTATLLSKIVDQNGNPVVCDNAWITYLTNRDDTDTVLNGKKVLSSSVKEQDAALFIEQTLQSKFCLAPRGYGRSSFRFFEAMLLDTIPVYVWDDIEWLPYQEILDYSTFSISISKKELPHLHDILSSISTEMYENMVTTMKKNRHWFTLEGMVDYIVKRIQS